MRVSLNALKQVYKQVGMADPLPDNIDDIVVTIGAQLGEIEEVIDLGKRYEKALVAKVVSCIDHPNADKLKVCKIDTGKDLVQVVCGAPNVKEGMLVVWLPPGAVVPASSDKEPLVLESREIRGEVSNGMLASPSELSIGDDHSGLLEIDKSAQPGDSFTELYKLDDYIIDIENKMFTHRPDCFGLLGIAREVSGIYDKPFSSPDWYLKPDEPKAESAKLELEVINEIPKLVPRFNAVAIADVNVGISPLWLRVMLSKFGIKSVNNIVDLTNFYMLFTGQPLHAYDYDKVDRLSGHGAVIKTRQAKKAEKLKVLGGKEVTVEEGTIMITTDKHAIGIGGVIGGADTEVDESTRNIILECANFDSYSIRRTSMHHGLFTDAVMRFTKNQSSHQTFAVISKTAKDIAGLSGGKIAGRVFDLKGNLPANKPIRLKPEFVNDRLGLELGSNKITKLLENVEFKIAKTGEHLTVTAPFWRTDVSIPEDVVEEVGRLYGYDNLPLRLPVKTVSPSHVSDELRLKQAIRLRLAALGANEVLNYSFVHGDLLDKAGQDKARSFKLKNALSPKLQYYRQGITPSLLEKVHPNIKAGFDEFALFELGRVHKKDARSGGLPEESARLGLVVASKNTRKSPAFYTARKYLVELFAGLNIDEDTVSFEPIAPSSYFQSGRAAAIKVGGQLAGHIGEYDPRITSGLKLPEFCAGFELYLQALSGPGGKRYRVISRYPATEQDICLRTPADISYSRIKDALVRSLLGKLPADVSVRIRTIDIFSKDTRSKQTTFRVTAFSYERTLTSEVMNAIFNKTAEPLKKLVGADII
ncbi:MAG TPA: phenylalanine--tRNA ligase subunit beta [Candidatus Saccharimonadales bacterium]|nr:phenylalanine--tRNA ligase subunit beta [Candidatus Saccharimonadales bacterium]